MPMQRTFWVILVLALVSAPGFPQSQAINGSIRGRVIDAAGAAVPAAKIGAVNGDTGFTRDFTSDDEGYFVFPNLPLGTYTVTIRKEGFETRRHTGIVLTAGTEAVVDSQLKVGAVTTEIEVTDLDSTNGTYVNGQRVARALLKDGDQLGIGRVTFKVFRSES